MERILCIISSLNAGGAETFLMKLYRQLSLDDYQFDFVVSKDGGCYTSEVLKLGGKIFIIPTRSKNLFGALNEIRSIVKNNKYKLVLKLGENSLAVLDLIAAKLGGARVLCIRACNAPTGLSFLHRNIHAIMRPLLNSIANVKIAPSSLAAEFMFGKRDDVKILRNGVDLNIFRYDCEGRKAIRKEFSIGNKIVIGHIGRFDKQKNHRFLLEVFKKINDKCSNTVLLLIGTGTLKNRIHEWINEYGLEGKVIFAGQRFDIPEVLSAMDIFVFPSFFEGMPNVVIEAQSTGLPCFVADTITNEANITGLVKYLPLSLSAKEWAEVILDDIDKARQDTHKDFLLNNYDIASVSRDFLTILGITSVNNGCKILKK